MVASKSKFFLFISRDDIGVEDVKLSESLTVYGTHWKEQNMFDQHSLQKRSFDIISNFVSKLTRVWYLNQIYCTHHPTWNCYFVNEIRETCERTRETEIENHRKIRFSSYDDISTTQSRTGVKRKAFYSGSFALSDVSNRIKISLLVLQQQLFKLLVVLISITRVFWCIRINLYTFLTMQFVMVLLIVFIIITIQSYVYFVKFWVKYQERWIERGRSIKWPPQLSSLNSLDLFLF